VDPEGLEPDKNKVYTCTSFYPQELFHGFVCAGGICTGLYPRAGSWPLGDKTGLLKDDTKDFDNDRYDCQEEKPTGKECNLELYRNCVFQFVNDRGPTDFGYDVTFRQCRTWAWSIESACREVANCD